MCFRNPVPDMRLKKIEETSMFEMEARGSLDMRLKQPDYVRHEYYGNVR